METTMLVIFDGWGINKADDLKKCDAVQLAKKPCFDSLFNQCPHTEITASGLAVGLPKGVMGNSEVGHQNIGAGRVVDQELVRIDKAFENGTAAKNSVILQGIENAKGKKLHLFGLCSDGGVHSVLRHLRGLLKICKDSGLRDVYIHFFADGRDTPPKSGINYLAQIEKYCSDLGIGKIATVMGRFWAMDRDNRWNRVEKAYNCIVGGEGFRKSRSAQEAVQQYYEHPSDDKCQGDEFIEPTQIVDVNGKFNGSVEDGDSVIFFNFRGDRPRELSRAFIEPAFNQFERIKAVKPFFSTLTEYQEGLCENVIFKRPEKMRNILGEYLSKKNIPQFRCAETEKYAHVTFFFNDYREEPFPLEDRVLVPSPKDITTYDQRPAMSAIGVKDKVVEAILSQKYGLIVVNFANTDMVGHTGNLSAAIDAVETVDGCLSEIISAIDEVNGRVIVTADHGNAEQMWDPQNNVPHTQHTTNLVPLIVYGRGLKGAQLRSEGKLADIAPTLLQLMGIEKPKEMTGNSLLI